MSSSSYALQMDEPLHPSSAGEGSLSTSSTSSYSSSLPSPLLAHFKLHQRHYALAFILLASFLIGLGIGAALFRSADATTTIITVNPFTAAAATTGTFVSPTAPLPAPTASSLTADSPTGQSPPEPPTGAGGPTGGGGGGGGGGGRPSGGPGPQPGTSTGPVAPVAPGSCSNSTPVIEEGPYFVDERIDSGDLTATSKGVQIELTFPFYNTSATQCVPLGAGSWVDIWEADYQGKYSDIQSEGTKGLTFLRGYQVTDASGTVSFKTIYPGWYNGRTTHLHVMARTFDASGNTIYRSTTQVYFDDSLTDAIYTLAPYNTRGARTTRNANDRIYTSRLQLPLVGDAKAGYKATLSMVLPFGK